MSVSEKRLARFLFLHMQEAQYVCLVRATDGNKKISTTVSQHSVSIKTCCTACGLASMIGAAGAVCYVQDLQLQTAYSSHSYCAGQR